jgi:hypothetical protein
MAAVVAMLAAGALAGVANASAAATTAGGYGTANETCIPYDSYKCERLPIG